jgi:S-adenosylmethionine:tRNA ribosyltransferase-isomerase
MIDEAARVELLKNRAHAELLVTVGEQHQVSTMAHLPEFVPSGSVMVLNTSGTFFARFPGAELPNGDTATVHFAQMLDESAFEWVVVVPDGLEVGDRIKLPGDATLQLMEPYLIRGVQASWEKWGKLWTARFRSRKLCFDAFQAEYGQPIRYPYDTTEWTQSAMQNCYSLRKTSAMMNNGGRNLTESILEVLLGRDVHIATLEMRTGVGIDQDGYPLPEFVQLDLLNAMIINAAINEGRQVIPVGTGVIRALDWFYNQKSRCVRPGNGWCTNVITPETGTWLDAWLSGMHEPESTHLAMGSAIMGEQVMLDSMTKAYDAGLRFHENGDTHLYLPASRA